MPLYDYICYSCGKEWDSFNSIDNRNNETCACGHNAVLKVTGSRINAGEFYKGYYDDGLGMYIESKSQRKREMKKQNLTEVG